MALRDQPYLPLYVQDFLTDEKLMECSAASTGIYIKIMCIMHKSDEYGTILLKQKDKHNPTTVQNFASKLTKHLPYNHNEILIALTELISEGVLQIDGDKLIQKRMVRDNEISIKRAESGSKGGLAKAKGMPKDIAKEEANTENETENREDLKGGVGEKKINGEETAINFYIEQVNMAKGFTGPVSEDYIKLARHICQQNEDGTFRMVYLLKVKKQLSLNDFSKLYEKTKGDIELIKSKIDSFQTNINYHKKYNDLYLCVNNWLRRDK